MSRILFLLLSVAFITACSKSNDSLSEPVIAGAPGINTQIGDAEQRFLILGGDTATQVTGQPIIGGAETLVLGFPLGLLNEQYVFGGVVTALSDKESETLGRLKLTDLSPIHVRIVLTNQDKKTQAVLIGCDEKCTETSQEKEIVEIPVKGVDTTKEVVYLDLSSLGSQLNLIEMQDPKGEYTKLKTKTSKTVLFDYSVSTLTFDTQVAMVPVDAKEKDQSERIFTTRWYLKLASKFHAQFTSREQTEGVGFFTTERAEKAHIERWLLPSKTDGLGENNTVKYFIKNVPEVYKAAFKAAFEEWNTIFVKESGRPLLSYEFVDSTDPRSAKLVTGDVRFNIVEWDLINRAPYGGLGPAVANQFTGEIFSSNILVQGPHIVKLYTEWFKANAEAQKLEAQGQTVAAQSLLFDTELRLRKESEVQSAKTVDLVLGNQLAFKVRAQLPSLEDPLFQRDDFEPIPKGVTFESYMHGYFIDMLTHELGHNLGLRHNFRGNLGAAPGAVPQLGKVSSSIMEYLGRGYRHLDHTGPYDTMAIRYGYLGEKPTVLNGFCTDEDVSDNKSLKNSAECSRDDATNDPFGFFLARLDRVVLLMTVTDARGTLWKVEDLKRELGIAINGVGLYAATAAETFPKWTNFQNSLGRPTVASDVKGFVVQEVKKRICVAKDKALSSEVAKNLSDLEKAVQDLLEPLGIAKADVTCGALL